MTRPKVVALTSVVLVLAALLWPAVAHAGVIERVSVASDGAAANNSSNKSSLSGDGRFVVFSSEADNLVPGDTNGCYDVFVHDRQTGATDRVSVASDGSQGNGYSDCGSAAMSADGRYVVFLSRADNLVSDDTNGCWDIFLRDRQLEVTRRVSVDSGGAQANHDSNRCYISADGSRVVFLSDADNLVPADTNGVEDVFLRDLVAATTQRVSVATDGSEANGACGSPSISGDGCYVVFSSEADDLVANDTNGLPDLFGRDLETGTTERLSEAQPGQWVSVASWSPSLSADSRYVAFVSWAKNLVSGDTNPNGDVFVLDRWTGTIERVSVSTDGAQANSDTLECWLSADGRYATYATFATNLVPGDTNGMRDVLVHDRMSGVTQRVNVSCSGIQANNDSSACCISGDGRYVTFRSCAWNLLPDDSPRGWQVFAVINPATVMRTSYRGTDRYFTALLLSQATFSEPLPAGSGLVLAPGTTFPEALCGAPLAAAYGGPVLLTPTTGLHNDVKAELQRLDPDYVFVIGLSATIRNNVQTALPEAIVTAIGGANIYQMSHNVADALGARVNATGGNISTAVGLVTIGGKFVDALGLGPLACAQKWPIILTDSAAYGSPLHAEALGTFSDLGITQMLKVGTYCAVPAGITGLGNLSGSTPPGVNSALARYYTNANIAQWAATEAGLAFAHLGIATGDKFPDALAAGPYLAKDLGILLVSPLAGPVPQVTQDTLSANAASAYDVTFIACIEPVIGTVKGLLP